MGSGIGREWEIGYFKFLPDHNNGVVWLLLALLVLLVLLVRVLVMVLVLCVLLVVLVFWVGGGRGGRVRCWHSWCWRYC